MIPLGDAVTLLVLGRASDLQVAGSSPGWAPLRAWPWPSYLLCLCHQAVFGTGQGDDPFGWESNRGLGGK